MMPGEVRTSLSPVLPRGACSPLLGHMNVSPPLGADSETARRGPSAAGYPRSQSAPCLEGKGG